jgi:hypothetical protein
MLKSIMGNMTLIITVLVLLAAAGYCIYLAYNKKWEQLRVMAYHLFVRAEKEIIGTKKGKERFNWVADNIYLKMPPWFRAMVTREQLEEKLQQWFTLLWIELKDLLDNGKRDKSAQLEPAMMKGYREPQYLTQEAIEYKAKQLAQADLIKIQTDPIDQSIKIIIRCRDDAGYMKFRDWAANKTPPGIALSIQRIY